MQLFAQGNTKLEMRYVGTGYCAYYSVYTLLVTAVSLYTLTLRILKLFFLNLLSGLKTEE